MIKPVFKLCTACMGLGRIEGMPMERIHETNDTEPKRETQECYICEGKGYLRTGEFVFLEEPTFTKPFVEILDNQPDWVKNAIYKKPE
jgi:hypothetical protein